jgi:hypothetical protein
MNHSIPSSSFPKFSNSQTLTEIKLAFLRETNAAILVLYVVFACLSIVILLAMLVYLWCTNRGGSSIVYSNER